MSKFKRQIIYTELPATKQPDVDKYLIPAQRGGVLILWMGDRTAGLSVDIFNSLHTSSTTPTRSLAIHKYWVFDYDERCLPFLPKLSGFFSSTLYHSLEFYNQKVFLSTQSSPDSIPPFNNENPFPIHSQTTVISIERGMRMVQSL